LLCAIVSTCCISSTRAVLTSTKSCISEAKKYEGKLYREKKKPQHQKKDSVQQNSQALVPRNAYVEDVPDADSGAVAIVDAPPRAPTPPPALNSLDYGETAALPPVNVFDFLDPSATPNPSRTQPPVVDEARLIEDSQPPAYEEQPKSAISDVMKFQMPDDAFGEDGFAYGDEPVRPTNERFDSSYNFREQEPDFNFTTPAPKPKHSRTKSKDVSTTIKKEERKRKRNSPAELDMTLVRAQHQRDLIMADAPPVLHSGLTGGLNRLLTRPELPPSPEYSGEYVENSPLSPMKRAKQGASKAFMRAQKDFEAQLEKDRKAELKQEKKEKERGRERERKERKASTALVKIKPKMKKREREDSTREGRRTRDGDRRRLRQYSSSPSPARERKTVKAIEYHAPKSRSPPADANGQLIVRPSNDLAPVKTEVEARAELFMSFINKGPDSERGMSVNKALKRYHRERYERWDSEASKADEEKELWKSMRMRRNDRGEIVLFFAPENA
jgi:cell growth-regulating nucleolar protein